MTTPLSFSFSHRPDGTGVFSAVGEIDMSNSADLADAVDGALKQTGDRMIIDLTRVEYLDSAALSILLTRADRIKLRVGPLLAPVLTISGLGDLTTVVEPHSASTDVNHSDRPGGTSPTA